MGFSFRRRKENKVLKNMAPTSQILIHNYGFWSSCRKLKKLNYAKPWPTSIRGHQVCIKTENNTQFVYPMNVFKYRPTHPESPEENFESLNPYDVNDDGRKDYSILKDPEFS